MLTENLKTLRKAKGLSQEELAIRLNVVRQTVSKWEKGLSVPDADLLIRIADIFEVSVSELLGAKIQDEREVNAIAEQLERINEQLAIKNRRARRIWKTIAICFFGFIGLCILLIIVGFILFSVVPVDSYNPDIGEYDTGVEVSVLDLADELEFDDSIVIIAEILDENFREVVIRDDTEKTVLSFRYYSVSVIEIEHGYINEHNNLIVSLSCSTNLLQKHQKPM
jgi:putative transcriptional regulator